MPYFKFAITISYFIQYPRQYKKSSFPCPFRKLIIAFLLYTYVLQIENESLDTIVYCLGKFTISFLFRLSSFLNDLFFQKKLFCNDQVENINVFLWKVINPPNVHFLLVLFLRHKNISFYVIIFLKPYKKLIVCWIWAGMR